MSKSLILSSPINFYEKYKESSSPHTSVLEFEHLISTIEHTLVNETIFTPEYNHEKEMLLQELYFSKKLYYDDVIRFCARFIDTIDLMIRKTSDQSYPSYFHRKRYFYYMEYCISKFPNIILFPTFDNIGATDLIKTRSVPVFFIGLSTKTIYADEFLLTPSEFFFHDINHCRIIYQQDEAYISHKNITKQQLIKDMETSKNKYYESIKSLQDNNLKSLMKMIIFEIVHEDGLSFVDDTICERLIKPEGEDIVERMNGSDIELVKKITPSTIGNVLFKLRCGFYDEENDPLNFIVDVNYRTKGKVIEATQELLRIFGCSEKSNEQIESLVDMVTSLKPTRKCLGDKMIAGKKYNKKTKRRLQRKKA